MVREEGEKSAPNESHPDTGVLNPAYPMHAFFSASAQEGVRVSITCGSHVAADVSGPVSLVGCHLHALGTALWKAGRAHRVLKTAPVGRVELFAGDRLRGGGGRVAPHTLSICGQTG